MSAQNPRKRAAPGAAPIVPMQQPMQQPYAPANVPADQMIRWNGADNTGGYVDGSANHTNSYEIVQSQPQFSNSLTRRPMNQALIPANAHSNFDQSWASFMGDDGALVPQHHEENGVEDDNIEELEERAQKAKRDAQGKRKQIPPFVQKISSFLEEGKNEDLIRWSEKGDSFIVLDEDEFARTLIPELFKHNNYASFVRQLNMYGFHKRVGLSDNSMKASERKNKSPSEYSNPYFRRGHPNLLWLINKPKSGGKGKPKAKGSEDADSDDEPVNDEVHGPSQGITDTQAPKSLPPAGDSGGGMQRKEVALIRDELKQVREQQKLISRTINHLQQNNRDLYNQAMLFQSQHDRHQNSINAILHFLANLFRKSLEEQGNTQSVGDILSSMLANQGQHNTQSGNVVDLSDFFQNNNDPTQPLTGTPHRKARGLLLPIPDDNPRATGSPSTSRGAPQAPGYQAGDTDRVTELVDGNGDTPPNLRQELENNPQEQMMRIINDHNATNSSGMDIPEAADFVANAPNNLNQDQRNQLANFMNRQSATPSAGNRSSSTPKPPAANASVSPGANIKSEVSQSPAAAPAPDNNNNAAPSLSPIMRSPAMPPLSMNQISTNQTELERLQQLQTQQDARISELTNMLGPLSPSGHIPGIDETGGDAYFDPQNVDLDQYFNSNAFLDDATFGGAGDDFNVNFDAPPAPTAFDTPAGQAEVGTVEVPSPTGTEEIHREDFGANDGSGGNKRRRVG